MPEGRVDAALRQRLEELESKHGDSVRIADIAEVVESMMATLKGDVVGVFGSEIEKVKAEQPEPEGKEEKKDSDEDLMHGPQLPEDVKSQGEVDPLLASFD